MISYKICIVVFALSMVALSRGLTPDEKRALLKATADECMEKEGATAADMEEMRKTMEFKTKVQKCMNNCIMEKFGMIKDGRVSVEGIVMAAKVGSNDDPDMVKAAKEVGDACIGISDPDRCEMSVKATKCLVGEATKRGYNPMKMMH